MNNFLVRLIEISVILSLSRLSPETSCIVFPHFIFISDVVVCDLKRILDIELFHHCLKFLNKITNTLFLSSSWRVIKCLERNSLVLNFFSQKGHCHEPLISSLRVFYESLTNLSISSLSNALYSGTSLISSALFSAFYWIFLNTV